MYFVLFLGNNLKKHLIINCVLAALSYYICTVVLMLPYYTRILLFIICLGFACRMPLFNHLFIGLNWFLF